VEAADVREDADGIFMQEKKKTERKKKRQKTKAKSDRNNQS
jgi:hypothetical protein